MFLSEIGSAGVISAYFFRHISSGDSLNVLSDPIEGQPVQPSYYPCVFGCGLVFWLLVLLWAELHDSGDPQADICEVAKLANLIAPITTLNLCGCFLAPFMKLPLLVRFLVLFQVSSFLALLLIWAFLYMILLDTHTRIPRWDLKFFVALNKWIVKARVSRYNKAKRVAVNFDGVGGKVDEAEGSGSGASGSEENRGRYGGNDGRGGAGGGGDRGASGSGHGSGASGSGENSGGYGGHGRDEGGTGSGHGSGAGGSGGNRGRSEGGDRGRDGGGGDPESGGRETNTEQAFKSSLQAFKSSKITEMSLMLTAQTTAALVSFHLTTPSSSSKALLVVVLIDQLVAYLCGLTSILLSSNKPEDSKAAKIFADIGFVCTALGFILMVAMFVPWYLVLIAVLFFGVVWLIFFRNRLKTRATEVWNYLTQSIKNCIGMLFESES